MPLYKHQVSAIQAIRLAWKEYRRVLAVLPTGAGKGTIAAQMMATAQKQNQRSLFIVHRTAIVDDIANRLRTNFGMSVGVIMPGQPRFDSAPVQVATVQSLLVAKRWPRADLLVLDEAPHYTADEWSRVADHYECALILGLTATPNRADGHGMGDVFDYLIIGAQYSELLKSGHIVPCEVFRPEEPLGINLAMSSVEAYQKLAVGPTIIYERTVKDAKRTLRDLKKLGVAADIVTHQTSCAQQKEILKRFREGRDLDVLVNVYVLTEGIDLPATTTIILGRPCEHASTYVQIVGRALRPSPGKRAARLIDLCGASYIHGLPTDDREYVLTSSRGREGEERSPAGGGKVRSGKVLGIPLTVVNPEVPSPRAADRQLLYWDRERYAVQQGRKSLRAARSAFKYEFGIEAPRSVG